MRREELEIANRLAVENERLTALLREYEEHAEPYWKAEIERLRALLHRWVLSCAEESSDLWIESRDVLRGPVQQGGSGGQDE